ncbi:MAG: extracellular solute-binding protein [Anaerolineae bacterium]|nr:extracellular solute-binding protein [Anaerolineae bacterium]
MKYAKKAAWVCLIVTLVIGLLLPLPVYSQAQNVTLTLLVPAWMQNALNPAFFEPFEAAHPGVRVELARDPGVQGFLYGAHGIETYLETVQQYVSAADVVFTIGDQFNITPEATQAGLILDLSPLAAADPDLASEDFYAPIWQSCQWDQGIWMLPFAAGVNLLVYDIPSFDRAGLAYPHEGWTMSDIENAARALYRDSNGLPGLITLDRLDMLLYSLTGEPFYTPDGPALTPRFTTPTLQELVQAWAELESEGAAVRYGGGDYNIIPAKVESPFRLLDEAGTQQYGVSLLPGGRAGLTVRGFAVSAGTQQPELAYELAKYLSTTSQLANLFPMDTHARQSLSNNFAAFPPDVQPVLQRALTNAIPTSDLRYGIYITDAISLVVEGHGDVLTALQNAEAQAIDIQHYAVEQRTSITVTVAEPPAQAQVEPGEIALQFGVNVPFPPLQNTELWDRVITDFVAADPQVGHVELVIQSGAPQPFEDVDCFFYPTNQLPTLNLATVLNLDPLMTADPAFDTQDVLPGVMQQVQRDDMTWAYPFVIQPAVLWYNPDLFTQAGVPSPESGWTVEQFEDALHQLNSLLPEDIPVFVPPSVGNSYLLTLFAAYGSLPLDYRTDPPTVNLADPATIEGMRHVLDLARDGIINFQQLNMLGGGGGFGGNEPSPLYADMLNMFSFRLRARSESGVSSPQRFAPYPQGSDYVPVAYQLGAGYISVEAESPEACYRWFNALAQQPGLFPGMPARFSKLADTSLAAAQGEVLVAYYRLFADMLQSPDVIVFPELFGSSGVPTSAHVEQMWLNDAINDYVLRSADLDTELAEVETLIAAYRGCVDQIQPFDPASEPARDRYTSEVINCAFLVDPEMQTHMH